MAENILPQSEEQAVENKQDAIAYWRKLILIHLKEKETLNIKLKPPPGVGEAALPPYDSNTSKWYDVEFTLNLNCCIFNVTLRTYPDAFGAYEQTGTSLSCEELNEIAKSKNFSNTYRFMESKEDWDCVFNDSEVKSALDATKEKIQKREMEEKWNRRLEKAIKIPDSFKVISPAMDFESVLMVFKQRYNEQKVQLSLQDGAYRISYSVDVPHDYYKCHHYATTLSEAEAVWVENTIHRVINNDDSQEWNSVVGGDTMSITIIQNGENVVEGAGAPILEKYLDLLSDLEKLAQYESLFESELPKTEKTERVGSAVSEKSVANTRQPEAESGDTVSKTKKNTMCAIAFL